MVNYKPNSGSFKKGLIPWNKGKRIKLDLNSIYNQRKNGKSIIDISKELGVSESLIRIRLKEEGYRTDILGLSKEHKQKISDTLKRKGIQPKERYSGEIWNKGKKLHYQVWNKGKQTGQKNWKHRTFTEETIKKIKEARSKQILPLKDTKIEVKIQDFLKQLNIEFYTHQYMREIEHAYQCDVMIPVQKGVTKKTIIECFGNYWHNYLLGREIDTKRCVELRNNGWRVLVFWGNEINLMGLGDLKHKVLT